MAEAQLAVIEKLSLAKDGTQLHPRLLEQYGYRARASARFAASQTALEETRRAHFTALLAAIAAGRAEVLRMHQVGDIHDHVLQTLEEELDLEEMSARRLLGDPA
jgi:CPA1 family monovalent cation:H+ antiporter